MKGYKNFGLVLVYLLLFFCLIDVFLIELTIDTQDVTNWPFLLYIFRIYLTSPLLVIPGIFLMWLYEDALHKLFGATCVITGIYWLGHILRDLASL
jgi:hypothetical protein